MPEDADLDALGAQYREAVASIGSHRQRQARTEVAHFETLRRVYGPTLQPPTGQPPSPEVAQARVAVDQAVADVEWCKAVAVAAGEAIKGESLAEVLARNEAGRAHIAALRQRGLALLEQDPCETYTSGSTAAVDDPTEPSHRPIVPVPPFDQLLGDS